MNIIQPKVEFITPINREAILKRIEEIGRTCYKSEDRITEESSPNFVEMLVNRGHEAMIEHINVTIKFTTNRGVTHEMVRHRIASYAQESTRYVNYSKDKNGNGINVLDIATGFNYDLDDINDKAKYVVWQQAMKSAEATYLKLIELGATPQEARDVLPISTKTEINMTCNLREWKHFIKLRASKPAHPEIRMLAIQVYDEFIKYLPEVFSNLEEYVYRGE